MGLDSCSAIFCLVGSVLVPPVECWGLRGVGVAFAKGFPRVWIALCWEVLVASFFRFPMHLVASLFEGRAVSAPSCVALHAAIDAVVMLGVCRSKVAFRCSVVQSAGSTGVICLAAGPSHVVAGELLAFQAMRRFG